MKKMVALLFLTGLYADSFAQQNKVELLVGGYQLFGGQNRDTKDKNPFSTIGIQYERNLNKRFAVGVSITQLAAFANGNELNAGSNDNVYARKGNYSRCSVGGAIKLDNHVNYIMSDVYTSYRILQSKRSSFAAVAGVALAFGTDKYQYTNDYQELYKTEHKRERYTGVLAGLKYNYALCNGKFEIGLHSLARIYSGDLTSNFQYGMQVGYRF